jgi:two-component system, NtrC family, nitrogen regulation response regulator NtrX
MSKENLLVVDDEPNIRSSLEGILQDEGYEVASAGSAEEALSFVQKGPPDLVLLDIWLPGMDGIAALERMKRLVPDLAVVMISGHGSIEAAVKAIKLGAYDFIEKPLSLERVILVVRHALDQARLEKENLQLRQTLQKRYAIVGESPALDNIQQMVRSVAPTNGRVLIRGESGTGKELVARAIHGQSSRRDRPFVEVNCAAIPEDLIESELFGHEKGSFTGATAKRRGKFELADGGTLFLDEVGDMSLRTQAKVLRVLEEQRFERVGGIESIEVDVRVLAASNKDLVQAIQAGKFREDLYYRLNVVPLYVPPLRERRGDVTLLVSHFLREFCGEYGKREKVMSGEAMKALTNYHWPGNVRELKNLIERLIIMVPSDRIELFDVESSLGPSVSVPGGIGMEGPLGEDSLREAMDQFEKAFILERLRENNWNISRTAEKMGVERSNLHRKLKALGIKRAEWKEEQPNPR